jgi:hypothetical protein
MKNNHIFKAVFALMIILGLSSCDDREIVQVENGAASIVMDLSAEQLLLDRNYPDNPALNVSWSQATYTIPVEVGYKIEASATKDFKSSVVLGTVKQSIRTITFTVRQINEASKTLGLVKDVQGSMYVRVISSVGTNQLTAMSNSTLVKVTPYALEYPTFYLVGAACYVGWDAPKAQVFFKKDNMSYAYTFMQPENFRFLGQRDWNPINYSIDKPETNEANRYFKLTSSNIVFGDQENMKFTGPAGIYKMAIDGDAATKSLIATPSTLGYIYPNLYVVGTPNGWDAATAIPMTKTSEGVFELTTTLAANSEMKFLGQKAFGDLEWGNILANNNGNSGFLGPKGDNSNITFNGNGGSYKITVNLKAGTYTIIQ